MNSFWKDLPRPFFVLAPMEAVTDVVFRHVVAKAAPPDIYFTEFTNATGWAHAGDKAIGGRLVKTDDEKPIVAQLWGSNPDAMVKLSKHCVRLGYHGIDINMGCPDASAIKGGGGAQMIRTPDLAAEMIAAAKQSGLPVSVKTRLGYSHVDEWRDWLTFLFRQDIVALTIHLRTKKEMSKVPAHFELIGDIKALRDEISPDTLLVVNGDIEDRAHGEQIVREHGVDGIMIGRGVFHDPFAFAPHTPAAGGSARGSTQNSLPEANILGADAETGPVDSERTNEIARSREANGADQKTILIGLLRYHLELYDEYSHLTGRPFDTLKRFFKIYVREFEGASELRDRLMHTKNTAEVRAVLDGIHA